MSLYKKNDNSGFSIVLDIIMTTRHTIRMRSCALQAQAGVSGNFPGDYGAQNNYREGELLFGASGEVILSFRI